ncbi:hypothetical protein MTX26_24630 [Bradyrhizobium sp. ISRA443]|uniref:hypothetical protein n=1 Tax=unclassified Bradyrhizobium TaxID=2631580 RepID=UPI00247A23A8|nr:MULTISPECIES: hypothetical protein [unclassified Bradyrhizobium]WGR93072.1 hypothetical protein MTX20_35555 [Bradyrhizobium sp. ISRA435]WGR97574.1 hypothetical protein MTX23_24625 [Bradyrhizobium sp. ISRA436]WGS04464.1 hypothetical protein MTX18_24630 [Bradyrhizobium sp. ISRA437]WGS11345.1 hypothetical protein MTX26_24630 [Bradyrhizobium sp. ISRA443]
MEFESEILSFGNLDSGKKQHALEVKCLGCEAHQTVPLDIIRRPKSTPFSVLPLVRARYGAQERGRKPQCLANAVSLSWNTTLRVAASCSTTKARALSNSTSSGHATELHEGAFQIIEPTLLPFVAECSDMVPARAAQRGNEQVGANLAVADLDQPFAKIDLQLLARRRLEPHRGARLRRKLLAIALHRRLTMMPFSAANSWWITSALPLPQTLLEPGILASERLFALRLSIGRRAAGRNVVHGVAANPELPGNPFATPQLVEPEYRRNLVRLQHGLPLRILEPQRS